MHYLKYTRRKITGRRIFTIDLQSLSVSSVRRYVILHSFTLSQNFELHNYCMYSVKRKQNPVPSLETFFARFNSDSLLFYLHVFLWLQMLWHITSDGAEIISKSMQN